MLSSNVKQEKLKAHFQIYKSGIKQNSQPYIIFSIYITIYLHPKKLKQTKELKK